MVGASRSWAWEGQNPTNVLVGGLDLSPQAGASQLVSCEVLVTPFRLAQGLAGWALLYIVGAWGQAPLL